MAIRLFQEPKLESPVLIASWPGIGNIGIIAVDILRRAVKAEEFGEIEPWDFFYPKKVLIRGGELKEAEFPTSKFHFRRTPREDFLFFLGEEQPTEAGQAYAEGGKAYRMANLVLDVAQKFGCRRVYTSGAAVAPIHHTMNSRVWAVPNSEHLIPDLRGIRNTVLLSDIEERDEQSSITGLNGLLLGVAKKRGLEAVCLMGEIPVYLQEFPFPYPKASRAVLDVLAAALGIPIEAEELDALVERSEQEIEKLYGSFPTEIREQLDKLKQPPPAEPGPITEEDKRKILEDIDKFFKKGTKED